MTDIWKLTFTEGDGLGVLSKYTGKHIKTLHLDHALYFLDPDHDYVKKFILALIKHHITVETLSLSATEQSSHLPVLIDYINENPRLRDLTLRGLSIDKTMLTTFLTKLHGNKTLKLFILYYQDLNFATITEFESLVWSTNLYSLDANGTIELSKGARDELFRREVANGITDVEYYGTITRPTYLKDLAENMETCKTNTVTNVCIYGKGDNIGKFLHQLWKHGNPVEKIYIATSSLEKLDVQELINLLDNISTLKKFYITDYRFSKEEIRNIIDAMMYSPSNETLREVSLNFLILDEEEELLAIVKELIMGTHIQNITCSGIHPNSPLYFKTHDMGLIPFDKRHIPIRSNTKSAAKR